VGVFRGISIKLTSTSSSRVREPNKPGWLNSLASIMKRSTNRPRSPQPSEYSLEYSSIEGDSFVQRPELTQSQILLEIQDTDFTEFRKIPWKKIDLGDLPAKLCKFLFSSTQVSTFYGTKISTTPPLDGEFVLALSADSNSLPALANTPWELTNDPENSTRFFGLHNDIVLCRLLEFDGQSHQASIDARFRILYAISNQDPHFDPEIEQFRRSLDDFGNRMHEQVEMSHTETTTPTYDDLLARARIVRPHIFIYIGHGRTTETGKAQFKFANETWTDVEQLAREMSAVCSELFLVITLACDTAWTGAETPNASGPSSWIHHGIPVVINRWCAAHKYRARDPAAGSVLSEGRNAFVQLIGLRVLAINIGIDNSGPVLRQIAQHLITDGGCPQRD
jgi:hypothetical protein